MYDLTVFSVRGEHAMKSLFGNEECPRISLQMCMEKSNPPRLMPSKYTLDLIGLKFLRALNELRSS